MRLVRASPAPIATDGAGAASSRWVTLRVLAGAVAVAYLTSVGALLAYAAAPMLFGWSTYVVESESMAPAIRAGDALVSTPAASGDLERGQVVVIDDPAVDGRLLSHRIVTINPDGSLITRGDANGQADSTPVTPGRVLGVGRLRVPFVGLPATWLREGRYAAVALWVLATTGAVVAAATDPTRRSRSSRWRPPYRWPRPRRRVPVSAGVSSALLLVVAAPAGVTPLLDAGSVGASFVASTANGGNSWAAKPDFVAPTASASVVSKFPAGYLTGAVKPSGTYRVYAQVTDTGNPASGTASVVASAAIGSIGLSPASATVGGVSYNHESVSLAAGPTPGGVPYDLISDDNAGNSRTQTGYSFTVEGTAPSASDVQGINKAGGLQGLPEVGDTLRLVTSEQIDPYSVLSGWTGGSTPVTVRMDGTGPSTVITVRSSDNSVQLPWGQVTTPNKYTTGVIDFTGSTMVQVVASNRINITLGTPSSAVTRVNVVATLQWTPVATPFDAAGNAMSTAVRNEAGSDADF